METSINGTIAPWPAEVWAKWHTFADACDPKLTTATVQSANYFEPRPYRNEYDRGSADEGFVYTLWLNGRPIIGQVILSTGHHHEADLGGTTGD